MSHYPREEVLGVLGVEAGTPVTYQKHPGVTICRVLPYPDKSKNPIILTLVL